MWVVIVRGDVVRHAAADPVRHADEVLAVALVEVFGAEQARDGQIDRLARLRGEPLEDGRGELDEALAAVAVSEAEQDGTGGEPAAIGRALDEPAAFERAHEPRGRALREACVRRELAHCERPAALHHAD